MLPADRVSDLEQFPNWIWNQALREDRWRNKFVLLMRFQEREGHARVPQGHVENGETLGRWVSKQRSNKATGQISSERIKQLETVPGWVWKI